MFVVVCFVFVLCFHSRYTVPNHSQNVESASYLRDVGLIVVRLRATLRRGQKEGRDDDADDEEQPDKISEPLTGARE